MRKTVALLFVLVLVPLGASAGIIQPKWNGTGRLTIHLNGTSIGTLTGWAEMMVTAEGNMSPLTPDVWFDAYCVDILHWSGSTAVGAHTDDLLNWNVYPASTGQTANQLAAARAASWLLNNYMGQPTTDKSALQLAIWEVLYETPGTTWNTDGGNVWFSPSNSSFSPIANEYLKHASDAGASTYEGNAVWIVTDNQMNGYFQDFATTTVPEPASVVLLGLGLLGVVGAVRRKSTK